MRTSRLLILLAGLAFSAAVRGEDTPARLDVGRIVAQLGSGQFLEREQATRQLDALGPAALDALRRAADNRDPEVRRRAEELVERIERRVETARLLEPKRLRLVCNNTPVAEAVDELARKAGFPLQLDGSRAALANRRVTLDTGETTFWEAYAQLCDKAGLVERRSDTTSTLESRLASQRLNSGNRVIDLRNAPTVNDNRLSLVEGKAPHLPTFYAGALRFQALPAATPIPGQARKAGEILFPIEVTPESSLQLQGILRLTIDKATDDQGQTLTQPESYVGGLAGQPVGQDVVVIVDSDGPLPLSYLRLLPVRLTAGKEPSKRITELKGTLTAHVRAPSEPVVTVADVAKSAGQTFEAADGTTLKVLRVDRPEEGQLNVQVAVETPPSNLGIGRFNGRVIRINRGFVRAQVAALPTEDGVPVLALLDPKGQGYRLTSCEIGTLRGNTATKEYNLTYQVPKDRVEPAKLILNSRRTALVEVLFTLKDIPLP